MTHFSLFTGIGGLDLAAEWAGFTTVGQVEWADYPTKVLEKHWPDVPRWRDVRDVSAKSIDARGIKHITVLSGGFPCQPHSLAGKRQASADERDLWSELVRIAHEKRPRWIVGENVYGLLSSEDGRFFGRILRDLDDLGYYAGWCCFPAYVVGAFFARPRVFIIARANSGGLQRNGQGSPKTIEPNLFTGTPSAAINAAIGLWNGKGTSNRRIRGINGLSSWMDRLKCLGNAVVPQQAYPIFQAIADIEGGGIAP